MTLHLIRIPISLSALSRWAANRGLMAPQGFDEGRALHHILGECFGPAVVQPFRLLVPPRRDAGSIYAYAAEPATALRQTANAIALPEHLSVLDTDRIEDKPMPALWQPRQRLGFDLRIRPVVRLASDLRVLRPAPHILKQGTEVDAWYAHVLRHNPEGTHSDTARATVYLGWLADRLTPAATLDLATTRLAGIERTRIQRKGKPLDGPSVTVHGTLAVQDPGRFATVLAQGVGRHRAYGYGMLLLRAAGRPAPER